MLNRSQHATSRRLVAAQIVGDQHPGHVLQVLQKLAKKPGCSLGVAPGRDQDIQYVAVLVDRPPQVVGLAVDLDEYLVKVPLVARLGPPAAQPIGVGLTELPSPLADSLVGDRDTP